MHQLQYSLMVARTAVGLGSVLKEYNLSKGEQFFGPNFIETTN